MDTNTNTMKPWMLRKIESTFFPVVKAPNESNLGFGLYNGITNRKITDVSKRYCLVKNEEFIKPLLDHFGHEKFEKVIVCGNTFIYEINTGVKVEIEEGDFVSVRIIAVNSYNKSRAYNLMAGAFRSYCSNGMYNGFAFAKHKKIHVGDIPYQEMVKYVLERYPKANFSHWKNMAKVAITEEQAIEFINKFEAYEIKDKENKYSQNQHRNNDIKRIASNYYSYRGINQEKNTVWGLFNRINWSIGKAFYTKNTLEYAKLNHKLEKELMNHFNITVD